jgi:hypothetical protein
MPKQCSYRLLSAVVVTLTAVAPIAQMGVSQAQATVYNIIAVPGISVLGTITTDGATGTLSVADITNWDISQPDTRLAPGTIDPANSSVSLTGGALTATSTELLFNFSDTSPSFLGFASNNFFDGSGGVNFQYCGAGTTTQCYTPIVNISSAIALALVAPGTGSTQESVPESGVKEIASAAASVVPEPTTWVMMLLGFAALVFARYHERAAGVS